MDTTAPTNFFQKHEFLIRRVHSLSGLIPVGAYMCVHLLTNSLTGWGVEPFQNAVYQIHSLGPVLPLIEWGFIFLPILFHGILGVVIIRSGRSNVKHYGYSANWRYAMQRASGMVALIFIFAHVFHLHGWFHVEPWLKYVAEPLGGAQFKPYNANSTLAQAFQVSWLIPILYVTGVAACVFHFANGLWTMGITWGVWISPKAQSRAGALCSGLGVGLFVVGLGAIVGVETTDVNEARQVENRMYEERTKDGSVLPNPEKLSGHGSTKEVVDAEGAIEARY